jgi:hypothetical protein
MPRPLWRKMQEEKEDMKRGAQKKRGAQTKLDGVFEKQKMPSEFSREGVLEAVARFVACDDQV